MEPFMVSDEAGGRYGPGLEHPGFLSFLFPELLGL